LHIGDVRFAAGIAKLWPMTDLRADEIASTLLARVVREIQNFAMNAMSDEGASAEQMWTHFVDHLSSRKELDGQPVNGRQIPERQKYARVSKKLK
jgi:hypothetical protein